MKKIIIILTLMFSEFSFSSQFSGIPPWEVKFWQIFYTVSLDELYKDIKGRDLTSQDWLRRFQIIRAYAMHVTAFSPTENDVKALITALNDMEHLKSYLSQAANFGNPEITPKVRAEIHRALAEVYLAIEAVKARLKELGITAEEIKKLSEKYKQVIPPIFLPREK